MIKLFVTFIVFFVTLSIGQPWLQPGTPAEPPVREQPFDSSQIIADKITNSKIPVLVDFWAVWCGPCRMLGPIIEDIKKKYHGKLLVMKVNVDTNRGLSAYFRIQSIPAVFFIADKSVVDFIPGLQPKEAYEKAIEKILSAPKKPIPLDSTQTAKPQPSQKPVQTQSEL
jgi:thioredoxin 1